MEEGSCVQMISDENPTDGISFIRIRTRNDEDVQVFLSGVEWIKESGVVGASAKKAASLDTR